MNIYYTKNSIPSQHLCGDNQKKTAKMANPPASNADPMAAALASLTAVPARITPTMRKLAGLPPRRTSTIRAGRTLMTARPVNLIAYLAYRVGEVNSEPCDNCAGGAALWPECVSVEGYFSGACTNCHYNSQGVHCSLRE